MVKTKSNIRIIRRYHVKCTSKYDLMSAAMRVPCEIVGLKQTQVALCSSWTGPWASSQGISVELGAWGARLAWPVVGGEVAHLDHLHIHPRKHTHTQSIQRRQTG